MAPAEILQDLADDRDLAATIANLEAVYFSQLELEPTLCPVTCYRLGRARDALAMAADAIKRLADCKGNPSAQ